jgi:subtilisin family serine protease
MNRRDRSGNLVFFELVEQRVLFATIWGVQGTLTGQDQAAAQYSSITGKGITVAVIDSGIDYNLPALGDGFGPGHKVVAGYDFADNDPDPMDTDGHGTNVAGVIAANPFEFNGKHYSGVAPDAQLVALRVTHGTDGAPDPEIKSALDWVVTNHTKYNIKVINISLGSGGYTSDHTNSTLSADFATIKQLGIAVFAASGNSGDTFNGVDGVAYPAADPSVYAVGAVNGSDTISTFTQRGNQLNLLAPGEGVVTTSRLGGYESVDGTSFASPYAAGSAALLEQASPGIAPDSLVSDLRASGSENRDGDTETGTTTGILYPRLNVDHALNLLAVRKTAKDNTVGAKAGVSDIAYDENGVLYLAYYDASIHSIRYATRDVNGLWSKTQVIDTSGDVVGQRLSIAVDKSGHPGIAYFDGTTADLKYAHFNGTTWDIATLDSRKSVGQAPSLAYDIDGDPIIAYYRKSGGDLRVMATDNTGVWQKFMVDTAGDVGDWADVSVADNGVFAVAYEDKTNGNLKYSRYADGQWTTFTVDNLAKGAAYIDLNLHNNQAFISYQDLANGDLKFAKRENAQWQTETVYRPGNTGQFSSLVFDSNDIAHIAFYSKSKKLNYQAVGNFGSWRVQRVGTGGQWLTAAAAPDEEILSIVSLNKTKSGLQFGDLI